MIYKFRLNGDIVPKARPRVTSKVTYMPANYVNWKKYAINRLSIKALKLNITEELTNVSISIILKGKHSRRGDLDNIAGSILDALVQSNVLKNDNMMIVKKLSIKLLYSNDTPYTIIKIITD